jgi:two-component sensor histidine kinase
VVRIITCVLWVLCICFAIPVNGQEYVVSIKSWGEREGLSHRQVNHIFTDKRGFIWVATPNGLNRFDGRNFKWYTKQNCNIPFADIASIHFEDASGNFLLEEGNTHRYALFNPLTGYARLPVDAMGGTKYIAMCDTLHSFDLLKGAKRVNDSLGFTFYSEHDSLYRYYRVVNGQLQKINLPYASFSIKVNSRDNIICVNNCRLTDTNYYVYEVSLDGEIIKKKKLPGRVQSFIGAPDDYSVFVRCNQRNYLVDNELNIIDLDNDYRFQYDAFSILLDDLYFSRGVLLSSRGRVIRDFNAEKLGNFDSKQRFYLQQNKHMVWVANDFGLHQIVVANNKFVRYLYDTAFQNQGKNSYRAMVVSDSLLLANDDRYGLQVQHMGNIHHSYNLLEKYDLVKYAGNENYAMATLPNGTIITGVGRRLYLIDLKVKNSYISLNPQYKLPNTWCIYPCSNTQLLLGTERGLKEVLLQNGDHIDTNGRVFLPNSFVLHIAKNTAQTYWLCTNTGLYEFDIVKGILGGYSENEQGEHYIPVKNVRHIICDAEGIYWLATDIGLLRWDRKHHSSKLFTRAEGLSNNNIYAVYDDPYGRLWLSSDYGLMSFDRHTHAVVTYLEEQGITNNEFNRISHMKLPNGMLLFGSLNGITGVQPSQFQAHIEEEGATLCINSLQQLDGESNQLLDRTESVLETNSIVLDPDDRFFILGFSLLNYSNSQNTTYYWKIEGIDTGWNVLNEQQLRLSKLPYGEWKLLVKAQSASGRISKNMLELNLTMVRPFYLRIWFIGIELILLVVIVYIYYIRRTHKLRKENVLLYRKIKERTQELEQFVFQKDQLLAQKEMLLKEIHHRVKNNLQVICAVLELQGNTLTDGVAKDAILESTTRVKSISLIHQHLYQRDEIATIQFTLFLKDLFSQVYHLYQRNIGNITLQDNAVPLNFDLDTAVPLGLILNELFTNSFKYAFVGATEGYISISVLAKDDHKIELIYKDSGPGLPESIDIKRSRTLGLRMIKRLVKQIGGTLNYNVVERSFTIIFLTTLGRKSID